MNNENVDRCVCCGEIIPEGSHICNKCRYRYDLDVLDVDDDDDGYEDWDDEIYND